MPVFLKYLWLPTAAQISHKIMFGSRLALIGQFSALNKSHKLVFKIETECVFKRAIEKNKATYSK